MGVRPLDWSPLTGGDPCPGDPAAWGSIAQYWAQRSNDIDTYRETLAQHTSLDGEGNSIRRLESAFSAGARMASLIADEFEKACNTARTWQDKLEDMQSRASEALAKAQAAQASRDDAQARIDALKIEAAKDESADPITSIKIHGVFGNGGLQAEIAHAQAEIKAAQKTVDDIRDEYSRESAAAIEDYRLMPVEDIYAQDLNKSLGGNPFSDANEVKTSFTGIDEPALVHAFEQARNSDAGLPQLLNMLSDMTVEQIQVFFASHPEYAVFATNPIGGDNVQRAKNVQKWWNSNYPQYDEDGNLKEAADTVPAGHGLLSEKHRQALIKFAPGFVGNTQGIQYRYRSEANMNALRALSSDPKDNVQSPLSLKGSWVPPEVREAAKNTLDKYDSLISHGYPAQIVTFEVNTWKGDTNHWDDVKAAISIGDLDNAESISYLTHGIDTNAQEGLTGHIDAAQSLYNQETRIFNHNGQEGKKHATVAWMNYEAPKGPDDKDFTVLANDKAITGGHRYAQDLDTLNTLRGDQNIRLNTVVHSYGTTTTFAGMTEMKTQVDSAVFLGSAGLPQPLVKAVKSGQQHLAVNPKDIAYTHASEDRTAPLGYIAWWHKENPDTLDGVTEISSEGGYGRSGQYFQDTDGHSLYAEGDLEGYLKEGTSSRYQTGLWTTGYRDQIGPLLKYIDQSDVHIKKLAPDVYVYEIPNERKDMSSGGDMEKLKGYAQNHNIDWDSVQDGDPR